jgi:uncharacterized membrane protein YgdD (TMEM256/DUF423 family)
MAHDTSAHDSDTPERGDEADRLASAAFWITMAGTLAFCGSIYAFVL